MQHVSEFTLAAPQFADTIRFEESDLKRRVTACLASRLPKLPPVELTVIGRTVIFRGDLLTAEEKRLCDECCRHVPGVARVLERLAVSASL